MTWLVEIWRSGTSTSAAPPLSARAVIWARLSARLAIAPIETKRARDAE